VILLENSNEWNLSLAKEGFSKKRERSKDWKAKEVKPHLKSSMFWKKREDEIYKLLGEILSKERKKGDHIFL
jgi:hypothetical protein